MTATLRLGASLKNLINGKDEYTVAVGNSVRESLKVIGINPDLIALVTVNEVMQTKDYIIQENDLVRLMAVIGGG